jgi:hypothetical protein
MIGLGTSIHVACLVLACKVTGKARAREGRRFICTKHLGACSERSLSAHAGAAANLTAISQRKGIGEGSAALLQASAREDRAWRSLHDQVVAKFEVRP